MRSWPNSGFQRRPVGVCAGRRPGRQGAPGWVHHPLPIQFVAAGQGDCRDDQEGVSGARNEGSDRSPGCPPLLKSEGAVAQRAWVAPTCARKNSRGFPVNVPIEPTDPPIRMAIRSHGTSAKRLRQQGHSPSNPLIAVEYSDRRRKGGRLRNGPDCLECRRASVPPNGQKVDRWVRSPRAGSQQGPVRQDQEPVKKVDRLPRGTSYLFL